MTEFFRFPHTPHLAWLRSGQPRGDKVLSPTEVSELLADEVVVEEKLDGANLGISVDETGRLRAQNRGDYLIAPFGGQFSKLAGWMQRRTWDLVPALGPSLVVFGEWCDARHSITYQRLPDRFIAFDVYDRETRRFWNTARRAEFAKHVGLREVPVLVKGRETLSSIETLVRTAASRFGASRLEGVVVRREGPDFLTARAKLVHPDFIQSIGQHWRDRRIEWNMVAGP
jgi:ATP-dependent RNA circularization protein (DNA/RNA ligase family)